MSAPVAPRCGKRIRNWKVCGKVAGHSGGHMSEEAYRAGIARRGKSRAEGRNVIDTHGYGGYTNGCRCQVCRDAKADYMRERRAAAFTSTGPVTDVTHGTRFAYEERGCRCEKCVTAERASSRWGHGKQNREAAA
jgi:hypothetical protein